MPWIGGGCWGVRRLAAYIALQPAPPEAPWNTASGNFARTDLLDKRGATWIRLFATIYATIGYPTFASSS